MYKTPSARSLNIPKHFSPPMRGFTTAVPLTAMREDHAVLLDNYDCLPDGLTTRLGQEDHVTAIPLKVERLHTYAAATGAESLWGTTAGGVYNLTVAGVCPAASIALTNGFTISTSIATGAGHYMFLVNATDTMKQYDGTTWTSIAVLGAQATDVYSYIETYRQRIFLVRRNSLELDYLAANAISGAPTNYPLGAIFRGGGYIVATSTWTIDGGTGPEDNLAVMTSKGEVAVFAGNDPASWSLRGVYKSAKPLGPTPMYKYGGDILLLTETGIVPLSSLIQSASIDRTQTVSSDIRQHLIRMATAYPAEQGWQIIDNPKTPSLIVNIPSTNRTQAVMQAQNQRWSTYSAINALYFARASGEMYFSDSTGSAGEWKVKLISGYSDNSTNIVGTILQAGNALGYGGNKKIELLRPYFQASGAFSYIGGIQSDFQAVQEYTTIQQTAGLTTSLWGTGLFGTATWAGGDNILYDWQTIADEYSLWKLLYIQTASRLGAVTYLGTDSLFKRGRNF